MFCKGNFVPLQQNQKLMETKVQIIELFTKLQFSEKLTLLEELAQLVEEEQKIFLDSYHQEVNIAQIELSENSISDDIQNKGSATIIEQKSVQSNEKEPPAVTKKAIEKRIEMCIECQSTDIIKWGFYRGVPRCKCNDCGHTFTVNTLTLSHGIKKIEDFLDYGETMFNGQFHSLSYMSKKYEISPKTAFDWRHKYLSSVSSTQEKLRFNGQVEMDDVWVQFNEKGRKEKTDSRKRSGGKRGDNDNQVKVLFSVERGGDSSIKVVRSGRLCKADIERTLGVDVFEQDSVLISDKHPSIVAYAKKAHVEHKTFKADKHVENKDIHVQMINNMASRFKATINNKMRGVSTKYLQNYANWFRLEERYKNVLNKIVCIVERYMTNQKAWDYFSNTEKIYGRFIEKYTRLNYEHPTKRNWKAQNWNYPRVEDLLI